MVTKMHKRPCFWEPFGIQCVNNLLHRGFTLILWLKLFYISITTLAAKNCLSISVLCIDPLNLHKDYPQFFYTTQSIYKAALTFLINWNEKWCNKCNTLTMDHKLVFENSSSADVSTLSNNIVYLKAVKYLNIRLRKIY